MNSDTELRPFIPEAVALRVKSWSEAGQAAWQEDLRCAALVVDLSGFTALTERFAAMGPAGAETLSAINSDIFGRIAEEVVRHEGDVVRFVGDAAICIWEENPNRLPETAIELAANAGLAVQRVMHERTPLAEEQVTARVAISEGTLRLAFVGGKQGRFEVLADGEAILQAAELCAEAPTGQVAIDQESARLLDASLLGPEDESPRIVTKSRMLPPQVHPHKYVHGSVIEPFIPSAVRKRVESQLSGWIAEFRQVTALFIKLPSLADPETSNLETVNEAFRAVQDATARYDGSINKFFADDKGHLVLAIWGLPHVVHEDDPFRAGAAAIAMRDRLNELGTPLRAGIATGRVFFGLQGNSGRLELAVLGRAINLAARLMSSAANGQVICDESSARGMDERVQTVALEPVEAKGFAEPVATYSVEAEKQRKDSHLQATRGQLLGRQSELEQTRAALQKSVEGQTKTVIVEGEPGIGKSTLLQAVAEAGRELGLSVLQASGEAIESTTPMYPWRQIFALLLNTDRSPRELREEIESRLAGTRSLELAPLLQDVIPADWHSNEASRQLTDEGRSDAALELMAGLISSYAEETPLLLILDDGHWFDSASWALAELIAHVVPSCTLLLATRSMDPEPEPFRRIAAKLASLHLRLSALGDDLMEDLLKVRLGASRIDPAIVHFVRQKSGGNPFFAEHIAMNLLDRQLLEVMDGRCLVQGGEERLGDIELPDRVEGLIASRIDSLTAKEQLTLKVASVVGRSFSDQAVRASHPVASEQDHIPDHLTEANRRELIEEEPRLSEFSHRFQHVLQQEVAYNLLSFSQQAGLHRAVARWLEKQHQDDTTPYVGLLAHHWVAAGDVDKSIHYLELAGDQARRNYANREAVQHFEDALRIGTEVEDLRRARWHAGLATARLKLADYEGCVREVDKALELEGMAVAKSRFGLALSLGNQIVRQAWFRLRGKSPLAASEDRQKQLMRAAMLLSHRSEYGFFNSDPLWSLHGIVSNLNLAERGGGPAEIAEGYAGVAVIAGVAGIQSWARYYARLAIEAANAAGRSTTTAFVHELLAVYYHGRGNWQEVQRNIDRALQLFEQAGDAFRWEGCLAIEEMLYLHRGETRELAGVLERLRASAFPTGVDQNQAWCAGGFVALDLLLDNPIQEHVQSAEDILSERLSFAERIFLNGVNSAAWLKLGDHARARDAALSAAKIARERPPGVYYLFMPLLWCAETLYTLSASGDVETADALRDVVRALRGLARLQSVAEPAAQLAAAHAYQQAGKIGKARQSARRAESHAKNLGIVPVEKAAKSFMGIRQEVEEH